MRFARVRPSDDFPNPILRLGKDASNYSKLLKKSTVERLQVNQRVVRRERPQREKALDDERKALMMALDEAAKAYAAIDLAEIAEFERDVSTLTLEEPHALAVLQDPRLLALVDDFSTVLDFLRSQTVLASLLKWRGSHPRRLSDIAHLHQVLSSLPMSAPDLAPLRAFSVDQLRALEAIIDELEATRHILFGYLFAGKRLRSIAASLRERCKLDFDEPHRALPKLKALRSNLCKTVRSSRERASAGGFPSGRGAIDIGTFRFGTDEPSAAAHPRMYAPPRGRDFHDTPLFSVGRGNFYPAMISGSDGPFALLTRLAALKTRQRAIADRFRKVQKIDYIGAKTKIESLNAQMLAEHIDDRLFIEFYDNKKNARWLSGKSFGRSSVSLLTNSPKSNGHFRASSPGCATMPNSSHWRVDCSTL
jgi:hypothetical protein